MSVYLPRRIRIRARSIRCSGRRSPSLCEWQRASGRPSFRWALLGARTGRLPPQSPRLTMHHCFRYSSSSSGAGKVAFESTAVCRGQNIEMKLQKLQCDIWPVLAAWRCCWMPQKFGGCLLSASRLRAAPLKSHRLAGACHAVVGKAACFESRQGIEQSDRALQRQCSGFVPAHMLAGASSRMASTPKCFCSPFQCRSRQSAFTSALVRHVLPRILV
jgi:hypothetical protein